MIPSSASISMTCWRSRSSVAFTLDRYGHLMPGNEDEAAELLDAYLERANTQARLAAVVNGRLAADRLLPIGWRPVPWRLYGEAEELNPRGYDGRVWRWEIRSEDGEDVRGIVVRISGTAMSMGRDALPPRIADARDTYGRTEIERILDWPEPPDELSIDSRSVVPSGGDPGPEGRELAEIIAWFADQDIEIYFTQAAMLSLGGEPAPPGRVTAHLQKANVDGLIGSHEGRDRLDAARKAQREWRDAKAKPIGPVTETNTAMPITPSLGSKAQKAIRTLRSQRRTLVWTEPAEPEGTDWMLQVLDEKGQLLAAGLGDNMDDALLAFMRRCIPTPTRPDSRGVARRLARAGAHGRGFRL
jgi:hypothetical protein